MYCRYCGNQIDDNAAVCQYCGRPTGQPRPAGYSSGPASYDNAIHASAGLKVLSFLLPLVGLILYLVVKDSEPVKAKDCGKFALYGFLTGLVLAALLIIIMVIVIMSLPTYYNYYDYGNVAALKALF